MMIKWWWWSAAPPTVTVFELSSYLSILHKCNFFLPHLQCQGWKPSMDPLFYVLHFCLWSPSIIFTTPFSLTSFHFFLIKHSMLYGMGLVVRVQTMQQIRKFLSHKFVFYTYIANSSLLRPGISHWLGEGMPGTIGGKTFVFNKTFLIYVYTLQLTQSWWQRA